MSETPINVPKLDLINTFGFEGKVYQGLHVHPNGNDLIYPLGNTVVIEDITTHKQHFLQGHTNNVTCIAVSKSGKYIASGQVTHQGFVADCIIWDFANKQLYYRCSLHKNKVEYISFSPNDKYLATLGGQDDGAVVIWDIARQESICGNAAQVESAGTTYCVAFANNDDTMFITAGNNTLRKWTLDTVNRKIRPDNINLGNIKRIVKCVEVLADDKLAYCGTTSGDILEINTNTCVCQRIFPEKNKFSLGITCIRSLLSGDLLVGTGDGTITVLEKQPNGAFRSNKKSSKIQNVKGSVSSIALRGKGHQFFVSTDVSEIYSFNFCEFSHQRLSTGHHDSITDIAFAQGLSELCATCSGGEIRIWNLKTGKQKTQITVPNMECRAISFPEDGACILSAWRDGKIRMHGPQSGKELCTITDAHNKGVTAISSIGSCKDLRVISGGGEGQVRLWEVKGRSVPFLSRLIETMKEHKAEVTCIKTKSCGKECVTSSLDGTCIIWDLVTYKRKQIIFSTTLFKCVNYSAGNEAQIIASGSDCKIGYWECYDGAQIRELPGSKSGEINGMDVSPDGRFFVSGGQDKLIKVWHYNDGEVTHVGMGHCGTINKVRICPQQETIVSVSDDGALFVWKFPYPYQQDQPQVY